MLKDIPICQDLLRIVCGMVSDKTFVRLTSLSKEMTKYKQIVPLKNRYNFLVQLIPNFNYVIEKVEHTGPFIIKYLIKESVKDLCLQKYTGSFDDIPEEVTSLQLKSIKKRFKRIPLNILSLSLCNCLGTFSLTENIIKLEIDDTVRISNFPPKLLYLKVSLHDFDTMVCFDLDNNYIHPKLPDTLQYLHYTGKYNEGSIYILTKINSFPKNLKKLVLDEVILGDTDDLPKNLESLYWNIHCTYKDEIEKLPSSLKQLSLNKVPYDTFADLTSCNKLKYYYNGGSMKANLPEGIEEIIFSGTDFLPNGGTIKFPTSLKKIYVPKYRNAVRQINNVPVISGLPHWYYSFF